MGWGVAHKGRSESHKKC